ncbi:MAG: hypothetical protein M4579_005185 [Chaenotheca gracillima]|nr:MAG: hypothetical protein M4579_005185 [Chaenotheca gracillima]
MAPKGKAKDNKPSAPNNNNSTPTNWPAFKPLIPPEDLSLNTVVTDQIITISNFFTSTLCKTFVSFLSTLPLQTTPGKPKRGDAVRVNDRFQIDDPLFARRLWDETGLRDLVRGEETEQLWGGKVIGLNPNIRVYRYVKGQFFAPHYDDSNTLSLPTEPSSSTIPCKTTWTLLIYLTSPSTGCLGGETVFYPDNPDPKSKKDQEPVVISLETGMALLHRHGSDCMLHEGREVLAGEKWVIRSDLCVER